MYPSSASGINRIMNESILSDYWMIMNMLILVDDYLMNGMKNDVLMMMIIEYEMSCDDNWCWYDNWLKRKE